MDTILTQRVSWLNRGPVQSDVFHPEMLKQWTDIVSVTRPDADYSAWEGLLSWPWWLGQQDVRLWRTHAEVTDILHLRYVGCVGHCLCWPHLCCVLIDGGSDESLMGIAGGTHCSLALGPFSVSLLTLQHTVSTLSGRSGWFRHLNDTKQQHPWATHMFKSSVQAEPIRALLLKVKVQPVTGCTMRG